MEWNELTKLTEGKKLVVEKVRIMEDDIAIEGKFSLPSLAALSPEDGAFVAAFIQCHGSIKDMEVLFGISYPTVKNRLNKIGKQLEMVEKIPPSEAEDILLELEKGAIDVEEALRRMKT